MKKSTVTTTWISGLIVLVVGLVIGGIAMGLMFAYGGTYTPAASGNGYDFHPTLNSAFWTEVGFMSAGFLIAAVGGIIQLAAWIGAVVNTYQLQDKTWFAILLGGGIIGLGITLVGIAAMVAYIIAGPDGMRADTAPRLPPESLEPRPTGLAPS